MMERWIPYKISEMLQWHYCAVAQALLDSYKMQDEDILGRIVAMDETWAPSYEPNSKRLSNEWKHSSSPRSKKQCPKQFFVNVIFIVAYEIYGVILQHAVSPKHTKLSITFFQRSGKNDSACGTEFLIFRDNAINHTAAAVTDLLRRWN